MKQQAEAIQPIPAVTLTKIQHGAVSALRNLAVARDNKRRAAAAGRAAPTLLRALPLVEDHHVAYKLLATLRMLVDGQGTIFVSFSSNLINYLCSNLLVLKLKRN